MPDEFSVDRLQVSLYTIPTDLPEADGTLAWDSTSLVLVQPTTRSGITGLGFAYGDAATATLVRDTLGPVVIGLDVRDTTAAWEMMVRSIRNLGRPGISSMAIAAVDIALWDLKARCLELPLFRLLGPVRDQIPIYGSGGFTTYPIAHLVEQLAGWVEQGIPRIKMKIGTDRGRSWREDLKRIRAVRDAVGYDVELFVDANGAYDRTQARTLGGRFVDELGVSWFEEPVTSDDLGGLSRLSEVLPLDVTAGEYGYHLGYFQAMLQAGAVDVLQADVGRCAGITEWLRVADAAAAFKVPFSAHCGPALHLHPATVPTNLRHIEYFHDHVRIDHLLFDGIVEPVDGCLSPDPSRPGLGLELKTADAERYRVS